MSPLIADRRPRRPSTLVTPDQGAFELVPTVAEDDDGQPGLHTHVVRRPRSANVRSLGRELTETWETTRGHGWGSAEDGP